MARGINIHKILDSGGVSRDWENVPLKKINRSVKGMPYPIGLAPNQKKVLVSIYLNKPTVDLFKKEANKYHTKYQRMMRAVLDRYADLHR